MSMRKPCDCPRCSGIQTANRQWGFDEAKVPGVPCLKCGAPIGDRPYKLVKTYARFGAMMFEHEICPEGGAA